MHRGHHPVEGHHPERRRLGRRPEEQTRRWRSDYYTLEASALFRMTHILTHSPVRNLQCSSWPAFRRVPYDFGEDPADKHCFRGNFDRILANGLEQFRSGMHIV